MRLASCPHGLPACGGLRHGLLYGAPPALGGPSARHMKKSPVRGEIK